MTVRDRRKRPEPGAGSVEPGVSYALRFRAFAKGARWKTVGTFATSLEAVRAIAGPGNWMIVAVPGAPAVRQRTLFD